MVSAILSVMRPACIAHPEEKLSLALPAGRGAGDQRRRLRIMLLTVGLGVGGTEGQILEIASRLDRNRFDVWVCALKGAGTIAHELQEHGVRVITMDGKGTWDVRVLYRLFRVISTERPDVIHAFLFRANLAARVAGRLLGTRILISSYRNLGDLARWHHQVVDRLTARWVHAITCCSEAVRQVALSRVRGNERKFITIPNGVDIGRFNHERVAARTELGLRHDMPVIGTICRLEEPRKGLSVLLEAMAKMVASSASRPCQLLIVGEGSALKALEDLSARLGLSQWVIFAGMRRDVARVLPLLEVFVCPSISEGFGIAIVEAMAAGRPVVATAVGGIPEIVVHGVTGLLVPMGDPSALAVAIQDLLNDSAKARAFGSQGQVRVRERFSIETVVKRHEELYEELVARQI